VKNAPHDCTYEGKVIYSHSFLRCAKKDRRKGDPPNPPNFNRHTDFK